MIIDSVGDELIRFYSSPDLAELFAEYAEGFVWGQHFISVQRSNGNNVLKWIDSVGMRNPAFRKLPLDSFIAASSRLSKSKLQIESIIKYTPASHKDSPLLKVALTHLQLIMMKIDQRIGVASNQLQLLCLKDDMKGVLNTLDMNQLSLDDPCRKCVIQGKVLVRGHSESTCQVILLDNALLIYRKKDQTCKIKMVGVNFLIFLKARSSLSASAYHGKKYRVCEQFTPRVCSIDVIAAKLDKGW